MKVIWKRPDGFHGASPSDYEVIPVAGSANIWLHKKDNENFPFRISGGWQDESATKKLNRLVNLLNKPKDEWLRYLSTCWHDSKAESTRHYLEKTQAWLTAVKENLKGDSWEVTIMSEVLTEVANKLEAYAADFEKSGG